MGDHVLFDTCRSCWGFLLDNQCVFEAANTEFLNTFYLATYQRYCGIFDIFKDLIDLRMLRKGYLRAGLGLSIGYRVIEKMGGKIEVE